VQCGCPEAETAVTWWRAHRVRCSLHVRPPRAVDATPLGSLLAARVLRHPWSRALPPRSPEQEAHLVCGAQVRPCSEECLHYLQMPLVRRPQDRALLPL
jgi:hypothetical protein